MDDETAIEKCRNGDQEAFRHLVERYQGQAVSHATAILGNREDALDAVQEAFIDAFRALKQFDNSVEDPCGNIWQIATYKHNL